MSDAHTARLEAALADRYRIERELGAGGMATVYLAEDVKHERKVALKVLKPELAAVIGGERFLTEIKTTANLQHPHILPLFDSGEADGFLYYVMPYIEGETLQDRIGREGQLGVEEAVRIARDVADALDYAHRKDIIHRDIKPANILLHDGRPVVADFGIALAISAAGGGRMTETGLSLGTPHYMSPEQASADRDLSARSDVYSLGCVLYEMLAGQPPHTGPSAQSILVRILTEDPRDVTEVRRTVPFHVAAAVMKSIEKLPADRFESARRFVEALEDEGFTYVPARRPRLTPETGGRPASGPGVKTATPPLARWLPWGVAVAAVLVLAWSVLTEPGAQPAPVFRMTLSDFVVENAPGGGWRFTISRDGSTIVAGGDGQLLYVRRSDDTTFRPLAGTEGALRPSISPDGAWMAFVQDGAIRKVQIAGGPILPVVAKGGYPHWHTQDEIIYYDEDGTYRVNSAGGPGTLIARNTGPRPFMLPGDHAFLHDGSDGLYLRVLGEEESVLVALGGSHGRYVPTGHVLYGDRQLQSVFAIPFDVDALQVTGETFPVLPSVNIFSGGAVQLAVSDNGTLVYGVSSGQMTGERRLTWIDVEGNRTDVPGLVVSRGEADELRLSPDGTKIAYDAEGRRGVVLDLVTGAVTTLVVTGAIDPVWAPDGAGLYVWSMTNGFPWQRVAADGSGVLQEWPAPEGTNHHITSVSPDGAWAASETRFNIMAVRLGGDSLIVRPYLQATWHEESGSISPDGRWLAYVSDERDGSHDVYLRSFPEPGPAFRVSSAGWSYNPIWAPDGSALYFFSSTESSLGLTSAAATLVRREVRLGNTPEFGDETELFSLAGVSRGHGRRVGDIHPDGKRFLFVTTGEEDEEVEERPGIGPVVVVLNWFQELKSRMGEGS